MCTGINQLTVQADKSLWRAANEERKIEASWPQCQPCGAHFSAPQKSVRRDSATRSLVASGLGVSSVVTP